MIAQLKGRIEGIGDDWVIVDVHGVGYLVHCSSRTLSQLVAGQGVTLAIETQVREDAITLYGFPNQNEKAFFRLLVTVQGVGAKVAQAILSIGQPAQLSQAIAAQDKTLFTRAPGVGPKLAARILSELKDKAATMSFSVAAAPVAVSSDSGAGPVDASPVAEMVAQGVVDHDDAQVVVDDAVSALVNLGYGRTDAFAAVSRALAVASGSGAGGAMTAQGLIGLALKDLGKGL